jgi:hypothetical protein
MISFLPQSGTDGPAATASLIDGVYKFNSKNGPVAGRYRVLVVKEMANQDFKGDPVPVTDGLPAAETSRHDEMTAEREWSFTADVSPDDVEFDFQVPDAAATATGG